MTLSIPIASEKKGKGKLITKDGENVMWKQGFQSHSHTVVSGERTKNIEMNLSVQIMNFACVDYMSRAIRLTPVT